MNIQIDSMEDLTANRNLLHTYAVDDINKRIADWLSMGGTLEDGYIKQQCIYAQNIINK